MIVPAMHAFSISQSRGGVRFLFCAAVLLTLFVGLAAAGLQKRRGCLVSSCGVSGVAAWHAVP
jgi:hypothetical protein